MLPRDKANKIVSVHILYSSMGAPKQIFFFLLCSGYPLHRENRENDPKKSLSAKKHREFGNFAKTRGIWFAQVENSLILKVKDLSKFAAKITNIF